ncbi:similar to An09g04430 [Aspergillus luchuensis]|uniref:Similar to An09g04430 n=1 Tax=Aspergillus kawachii TaxID=1069201 RepID=A0A146FRU2_ASPKA|nr:similar to An09g04430 [Aspergillus luchuensis]
MANEAGLLHLICRIDWIGCVAGNVSVQTFRWLKGKASALCWQFVSQRSASWRRILTLLRVILEAIRAGTVGIAAKVRPLVVAVMKEVREATLEVYGFVVAAFRAIKQWFTCEQQTSHDHDGQARNAWCKRVVLAVTVKSGRSYKAIKDAIGIESDSPRNYRNRNQTGSLPEPPGFMRHFAVGGARSALLTGTFPAVFPIAFLGFWAFGMGTGIACIWRVSRVGTKEYPKWKARSNELEQRFPQLRGMDGE